MSKLPVKERIVKHVEDTLRTIQPANGFNYPLKIERPLGTQSDSNEHLQVVLSQLGEEFGEVDRTGGSVSDRQLKLQLEVFVLPLPTDKTPLDQYANLIEADIVKALLADVSRGGLAHDTRIDPADPGTNEGEGWGFTMDITISYRTQLHDPYIPR